MKINIREKGDKIKKQFVFIKIYEIQSSRQLDIIIQLYDQKLTFFIMKIMIK